MPKKAADFEYTGTDNLEVMAEAENYNRFLLDLVARYNPDARELVDFGAGIGTFDKELQDEGYNLACVEYDQKQLSLLKKQGFKAYKTLSDIKPNSVEYIFTLNVMEHIEHQEPILADFIKVLKPEGKVLIYVPAFQILFSSMDTKVGHFRRYRKQMLRRLLESQGFIVETVKYADTIGFFATIAYKLIGNNRGDLNKRAVHLFDKWIFPLNRLLDPLFSSWFGKNVYIVARKPKARS